MGWATGGRRDPSSPLLGKEGWLRSSRGGPLAANHPAACGGTPPQERRGYPILKLGFYFPALSLRTKLALVALVLLSLPWAGYEYLREMERFLLEGQEQALPASAGAAATARQDRRNLRPAPAPGDPDVRSEAEEELRRLAAERGEPPEEGAGPTLIIDREESAGRSEPEEIAQILKGVERTTARIWVVTRELRVLALAGSLRREGSDAEEPLTQRVLGLLIPRPNEDFDDAIADDALATGREIAGALQGRPGFRLRNTPDGRAVVISAAHPIWNGDEVAGAVVVEESTNPILSVRSQALERLLVLTLAAFADARVYTERAEEGLKRLGTILTRMSEATRLEQGLNALERERFALAAVVAGCVEGYRLAYPHQPFDLALPQKKAPVEGSPDLAAQLLDKLVANAVDFSSPGMAVRISLSVENGVAELGVENQGPPLPEEMRGKLFESMVSVRGERAREGQSGEPHLGLGLYVARLIAEFHGGTIAARNLASGGGVAVSATFRSS